MRDVTMLLAPVVDTCNAVQHVPVVRVANAHVDNTTHAPDYEMIHWSHLLLQLVSEGLIMSPIPDTNLTNSTCIRCSL